MGMFDSLRIVVDGKDTEIQTKRFDCCLATYWLGDCVDGAAPGVRVYFDELAFNADGKLIYGRSDQATKAFTLFVVLAHGIFVEYRIDDSHLDQPTIQAGIRQLRERWGDSARLIDFLVGVVREKQQTIERLDGRIARAAATIASARRLAAGEELKGLLGLVREEDRRLSSGDDPLDVLEWALGSDEPTWGFGSGTGTADPLADYRL